MGVVADIERQLGKLRVLEEADGTPELRTSTMTHIVWCPPEWHAKAKVTLAGLAERHPARTIFLIPEPGRKAEIVARAELKGFQLPGMVHEVISEVIQIRLRGDAAAHPGSVVTPLLVSDLPVFCRWRGEPRWGSGALSEILDVTDRLVVDSSEWRGLPLPTPIWRRCSSASPSPISHSLARSSGAVDLRNSGRRSARSRSYGSGGRARMPS